MSDDIDSDDIDLEQIIRAGIDDPAFREAFLAEREQVSAERTDWSIGGRLAAVRRRARLTQSEVAERTAMHRQNVARLESPAYASYKIQALERLGAAYGQRLRVTFVDENGRETVLLEPESSATSG